MSEHNDTTREDNYPETPAECVAYAEYIAVQSLTRLAAAIQRLSRFNRLCAVGGNDVPKIIMYNEAKVAHERLMHVAVDIDDALTMMAQVQDESRPDKEVPECNEPS